MFKGKVLAYPLPAEQRYRNALEVMIDDMLADYGRQVNRLIKNNPEIAQDYGGQKPVRQTLNELSKKWKAVFAERSKALVDRMINQVDSYSKHSLNASLKEMSGGLKLKPPNMPRALKARISASVAENVGLIKSIPEQFHQKLSGIVLRSIQNGGTGTEQIYEQIKRLNQVTKNRAEFIAVDQTRKISTATNSERMKSVGVKQFEWIHSGGGVEPRPLHVEYDGQIFDLDDPPIIDEKTGERGLPGVLINCRCRMRPIVDFTQYLQNENE